MRDDLMTAGVDLGDPEPARQEVSGGETILLVEEEDATRAIVSAELRRHGYRVLEAATPAHAYEICAPQTTQIDLLITDVVMSDITGPALAQRLVGVRPRLRVLFVSGEAGVTLPFNTAHPNVSFLSKPFLASALLAKVHEALTHRG